MRRRKRVDEGIYEDAYGLAATVKANGKQRELRFEKGTSLPHIQAWRESRREALLDDSEDAAPVAPGTFADELTRHGARVSKSDHSHLKAWLPWLGPRMRRRIRSSHLRAAVDEWTSKGVASRTIIHRLRVLREMWRALDGARAPSPADQITPPKPAEPHPTAVPWSMVQAVAESLKNGKSGEKAHGPKKTIAAFEYASPEKTRARFLVLATTGQRPAQVMRAKRTDLDLKRRLWIVRPAKGGTAIALPLDTAMIAAWRVFIDADAWGEYDGRSFAKTLRRHGWPEGVRPYTLRHTLAIDMILGGADLMDVQGALGHRQIATTQRYYGPLMLARQRKALRLKRRGRLG